MHCKKCKKEIANGDVLCMYCGAQLKANLTYRSQVKAAMQGDAEMWTSLYLRTEQELFFLAQLLTGDKKRAVMLLQEVYILAIQTLEELTNANGFRTWMKTLLRVLYHDRLQQGDLSPADFTPGEAVSQQEIHAEFLPASVLEEEQARAKVLALIGGLSVLQRETVLLFYYEGLTIQSIAQQMECTQNTVKARLKQTQTAILEGLSPAAQAAEVPQTSALLLTVLLREEALRCTLPTQLQPALLAAVQAGVQNKLHGTPVDLLQLRTKYGLVEPAEKEPPKQLAVLWANIKKATPAPIKKAVRAAEKEFKASPRWMQIAIIALVSGILVSGIVSAAWRFHVTVRPSGADFGAAGSAESARPKGWSSFFPWINWGGNDDEATASQPGATNPEEAGTVWETVTDAYGNVVPRPNNNVTRQDGTSTGSSADVTQNPAIVIPEGTTALGDPSYTNSTVYVSGNVWGFTWFNKAGFTPQITKLEIEAGTLGGLPVTFEQYTSPQTANVFIDERVRDGSVTYDALKRNGYGDPFAVTYLKFGSSYEAFTKELSVTERKNINGSPVLVLKLLLRLTLDTGKTITRTYVTLLAFDISIKTLPPAKLRPDNAAGTTESPPTKPPVTNPPATKPPTTNPPATKPPTTTPAPTKPSTTVPTTAPTTIEPTTLPPAPTTTEPEQEPNPLE